jgi:hypothetical protein
VRSFVPAPFGLAVAVLPDFATGFACVGRLAGVRGLTEAAAATAPTSFGPGVGVSSPGAAVGGFSVSPTVGSVTTVGSEMPWRSSDREGEPGGVPPAG